MRIQEQALTSTSDDKLLQLFWESQDQAAFAVLTSRYATRLFAFCCRGTFGDHEAAKELVQDCFEELLKAKGRVVLSPETPLWNFLQRIAWCRVGKWRKSMGQRVPLEIPVENIGTQYASSDKQEIDGPSLDPLDTHQRMEALTILAALLKEIPLQGRDVIQGEFIDGLSLKELAKKLHVKYETLKSRKRKALRDLEAALRRRGINDLGIVLGTLVIVRPSADLEPTVIRNVLRSFRIRKLVRLVVSGTAVVAAMFAVVQYSLLAPSPNSSSFNPSDSLPIPTQRANVAQDKDSINSSLHMPQTGFTQNDEAAQVLPSGTSADLAPVITVRCVNESGTPVSGAYVLAARMRAESETSARQDELTASLETDVSTKTSARLKQSSAKGDTGNELMLVDTQTDPRGVVQLPRVERSERIHDVWHVIVVVPRIMIGVWREEMEDPPTENVVLKMVPTKTEFVAVDVRGDSVSTAEVTVGIRHIASGNGRGFYFPRRLATEVANRAYLADVFGFLRERTGTRIRFENMPIIQTEVGDQPVDQLCVSFFAESAGFRTTYENNFSLGSVIVLESYSNYPSVLEESTRLNNSFLAKSQREFLQEQDYEIKTGRHGSAWK